VELAETERLFLRVPEQGKIDPPGEGYDGQIRRLAAFNNRLDCRSLGVRIFLGSFIQMRGAL
jgi:hypothetical protein